MSTIHLVREGSVIPDDTAVAVLDANTVNALDAAESPSTSNPIMTDSAVDALILAGAQGGSTVSAQALKAWAESMAYESTSITRDSDGVVTTAIVKWPDGSAGTFTTTTKNSAYLAVDAYTVTHTASGKTVTQEAVTRDSNGAITTKPELTVA